MPKFRRTDASTHVTYLITDRVPREIPDHSITRSGRPFRHFRPTHIDIWLSWGTGKTVVEMRGPGADKFPALHRLRLEHYNDAAGTEYAIVRDAVNQTVADHDAGEI